MSRETDKIISQVNDIFERGVLIDLDVSWWAGQAKLRPQDLGIPSEDINLELFSLGRKRFIPKSWIGSFRKWEQKARWLIGTYTFQYKKLGGWFVPLTAVPFLVKNLEECKANFFEIVNEFGQEYPRIKEKMIQAYEDEVDTIYKRLKTYTKKLPDINTFRKNFMAAVRNFYPKDPTVNFAFSWTFFEMTLPREAEKTVVSLKKKLKKREEEQLKQRTLVQKYNDMFQRQVGGFLDSVVKKLRSATVELVERVRNQITEGKVTDSRLNRLREHIDRFKILNFMDDNEVGGALQRLNKELEHSADDFNTNQELEERLRGSLRRVVEVASRNEASVVKNAFGRKRKIVKKK